MQGYRYRRLRKAPRLTPEQIVERYNWCLRNRNNDFFNYIFVDETKIMINEAQLYHSRLKTSLPNAICITSNFHANVNLWGGISKMGATQFLVFLFFVFYLKQITVLRLLSLMQELG